MVEVSELDMLGEAARRSLSHYPDALKLGKKDVIDDEAINTAVTLASEAGWLLTSAPEEFGGLGLGLRGAAVLANEVGRALLPGPLMTSVVLLPALAEKVASFKSLAKDALEGKARVSLGVKMSGRDIELPYVLDHTGGATDVLVFLPHTEKGSLIIRWFKAAGLTPRMPFDPTCPVAELEAEQSQTEAEAILAPADSADILGAVNIWIASELVGIAQRVGELSANHARDRKQFGIAIGANQSVKHRIVDDFVLTETASALTTSAAEAWDSKQNDRVLLAHTARVAATEAAFSATAYCVQVHGGLGFSWEHTAHLHYKRARRLASILGNSQQSLAAIGRAICNV